MRRGCSSLVRRNLVVMEPAEVESDPSRGERDFRLVVQGDRRGRVQCDDVPDQLRAAIVEPLLARERARRLGSFYLEALGTGAAIREPKIVEQRSGRDDFR